MYFYNLSSHISPYSVSVSVLGGVVDDESSSSLSSLGVVGVVGDVACCLGFCAMVTVSVCPLTIGLPAALDWSITFPSS